MRFDAAQWPGGRGERVGGGGSKDTPSLVR